VTSREVLASILLVERGGRIKVNLCWTMWGQLCCYCCSWPVKPPESVRLGVGSGTRGGTGGTESPDAGKRCKAAGRITAQTWLTNGDGCMRICMTDHERCTSDSELGYAPRSVPLFRLCNIT